MNKATARRIHAENLADLRNAPKGQGNAMLNSVSFFAARCYAAGAFDENETEEIIKNTLLTIVTKEWQHPHPTKGAKDTIDSGWRGGLVQPVLLKDGKYPQVAETIEDLNRDFFIVEDFGGKTLVCWEDVEYFARRDGNKSSKSTKIGHQSFKDFHNRYSHLKIQVGEKDNGDPLIKNKADVWINNHYREQYRKVIFAPKQEPVLYSPSGGSEPHKIKNLWRGFAFEPKKGDCSLYLAHLRDNVCRGIEKHYTYLIRWMANGVQYPDRPGEVAFALYGQKGVGKNVAAESYTNLFGSHSIVVSDEKHVTGNFNAHLFNKCALVSDEALYAKNPKHDRILKRLITGNNLIIEQKGIDAISVPNFLHIIILGNDSHIVPATDDDRRYFVLECGKKQQKKFEYFEAINQQLNNGGYEALLHYLLYEVDLSHFNVRDVPHTKELDHQVDETLAASGDGKGVILECLKRGLIPGSLENDGSILVNTNDLIEWAKKANSQLWGRVHYNWFKDIFGEKGLNFKNTNIAITKKGPKRRYWIFPPLPQARERWNATITPVEWDTNAEWETTQLIGVPF